MDKRRGIVWMLNHRVARARVALNNPNQGWTGNFQPVIIKADEGLIDMGLDYGSG